ncbi:hypothetical protein [Streptomyces tanashiensis]|uniref:DUF3558 domain-containing protein n=1 Tax=Streptomyces tanashiensis TaxID=67367 RepID=A0ABY6R1U2_9ACTN|nr:hypothetical protein [Streptomyces tanashiensis]UZX23736.1 hypothetical protein LDH80_24810 [Streptomyces tanashiensis]
MRSALVRTGAAVAVAALLTSCSGGGESTEEPKGLTAAEACGGFAGDAAATAALKAVLGGERFQDFFSKPDKALSGLRDAAAAPWADSYRPQPVTYCGLRPAEGGPKDLKIEVGAVRAAPAVDERLADKVTYFTSGLRAYSSSGLGKLYFSCRLKAPAHEIVVETSIWGPGGVPEADLEQRTRLITLGNAAARAVSAELGCEGDGLATGVPAKART